MKNGKSLLKYMAIPLLGVNILFPSCSLDDSYNEPKIYEIKLADKNNDGLKDIVIKDSRGRIKEIYLQREDGKYISLKEIYREKIIKDLLLDDKSKKSDSKDDEGIPLLLNPIYNPYFFPSNN
jgi:hypothetical protein